MCVVYLSSLLWISGLVPYYVVARYNVVFQLTELQWQIHFSWETRPPIWHCRLTTIDTDNTIFSYEVQGVTVTEKWAKCTKLVRGSKTEERKLNVQLFWGSPVIPASSAVSIDRCLWENTGKINHSAQGKRA